MSVGAKQVSSASPTFDLRYKLGKAGETFALPLQKNSGELLQILLQLSAGKDRRRQQEDNRQIDDKIAEGQQQSRA